MDKLFTAVPRSLVTTLTVLYSFCVFTKPYIFLETATDGSINLLQLSFQTLFSVHFWIYKFPFSENNSNRSGSSSSNKPLPKWCDLNSSLCMLLRAFLSSVVIFFFILLELGDVNESFSTNSINALKLLVFVFSFLKFTFEDFASTCRLPSWRTDEFDIFVVWISSIELVSTGFEARLSLLTKLSISRLKLHQLYLLVLV